MYVNTAGVSFAIHEGDPTDMGRGPGILELIDETWLRPFGWHLVVFAQALHPTSEVCLPAGHYREFFPSGSCLKRCILRWRAAFLQATAAIVFPEVLGSSAASYVRGVSSCRPLPRIFPSRSWLKHRILRPRSVSLLGAIAILPPVGLSRFLTRPLSFRLSTWSVVRLPPEDLPMLHASSSLANAHALAV